jgi:hypothetical protein
MTPDMIQQIHKRGVLKEFTKMLHQDFLPPSSDIPARKEFATMLMACVNCVITSFPFKTLHSQSHAFYSNYSQPTNQVIGLLTFAFQVGLGAHVCADILDRAYNAVAPASKDFQPHLSNVLVPLIPQLREFMVKQNVTLTTEPCATFCANVVKTFAREVLARAPVIVVPPSLLNIPCGCQHCQTLKAFFRNDNATVTIRASQKLRTHVEQELKSASYLLHGVSYETVRQGTPHSLVVRAIPHLAIDRL